MKMRKLTIQEAIELKKQTGQKAPRTRRGIEGALLREAKNMDYHRVTEKGVAAAMARVGAYEACLREIFEASDEEIENILKKAVY